MPAIQWDTTKAALQNFVADAAGLARDHVAFERQYSSRPTAPFIEISVTEIWQPAHDWKRKARNPLLGQGPLSTTAVAAVAGSQLVTAAPHEFVTGDGPIGVLSDGVVPSPLDPLANYWLVADDATHLRVCASYRDTGGNNVARGLGSTPNPITTITLTDAGSGNITIVLRANAVRAGKEVKVTARGLRVVTFRLTCFGAEGSALDAVQLLNEVLCAIPLHVYELDQAGLGMATLGTADVESKIRGIPGKLGTAQEPRAVVEMSTYLGSSVEGFESSIERITVTPTAKSVGGDDIALPTITVDLPD